MTDKELVTNETLKSEVNKNSDATEMMLNKVLFLMSGELFTGLPYDDLLYIVP